MKKWEYLVTDNPANNQKGKQVHLNKFGAEGWELVCVENNTWYIFKRIVEEMLPASYNKEWQVAAGNIPEYTT